MTKFEDIKKFDGILNMPPANKQQAVRRGAAGIICGTLFVGIASWILFVKLGFFTAPRLALYFPGPYPDPIFFYFSWS